MKKRYTATGITAVAIGVALLLVGMKGYSVVLYYGWLFILFFLAAIAGAVWKRQPASTSYLLVLAVLTMAAVVGGFAGHWTRRAQALSVCRRCEPIFASLNAYKQTHGSFPTSAVPILGQTGTGLNISQGRLSSGGIGLEELNSSDVVVYLQTNSYLCVVPVTKQLLMSFTRLYVYRRDSDNAQWVYDKMVWTLGLIDEK